MTSDHIEALMAAPPKVSLSRWQIAGRVASALCAAVSLVAITIALLASAKGGRIAACINSALASRVPIARVTDRYDTAMVELLASPPRSDTQKAAYLEFLAAAKAKRLADEYVLSHPLGKCG